MLFGRWGLWYVDVDDGMVSADAAAAGGTFHGYAARRLEEEEFAAGGVEDVAAI